jgi:hypothetical protein
MSNQSQDFQPLPIYTETSTSNSSWVNVTVTKTEFDGSTTQVINLVPKK